MDENQALLKRLQAKKSQYNVIQWNKEYRSRTKMLSNICEYPYQFSSHLPKITHSKVATETNQEFYETQYNPNKRAKCIA